MIAWYTLLYLQASGNVSESITEKLVYHLGLCISLSHMLLALGLVIS